MVAALLADSLWDLVEPFLPIPSRRPLGGPQRVSDRACLGYCLHPSQRHSLADAPAGTRVRVGMTCWRRLRDWQRAGVWDLIHSRCWIGSLAVTKLIGRARSWTVVPSAPPTEVTRPGRIPPTGPIAGTSVT